MKNRTLVGAFSLAVLSLFAVGAQAQYAHHRPPEQSSGPGMMGGGMIGQGMMSMRAMGQGMMANHQEMQKLMGRLMQNMTVMENEMNPASLKKLMGEHRALLEQMRGEMMQQGKLMSDFMENCPLLGASQRPAAK
jgi:hypothetical protein